MWPHYDGLIHQSQCDGSIFTLTLGDYFLQVLVFDIFADWLKNAKCCTANITYVHIIEHYHTYTQITRYSMRKLSFEPKSQGNDTMYFYCQCGIWCDHLKDTALDDFHQAQRRPSCERDTASYELVDVVVARVDLFFVVCEHDLTECCYSSGDLWHYRCSYHCQRLWLDQVCSYMLSGLVY